jgi:phosphoenolpyruvate carboxylase
MLSSTLLRCSTHLGRAVTKARPILLARASASTIPGSQNLSSFGEPDPSLFSVQPLSSSSLKKDKNAPLRGDIRTMGSMLGKIIVEHEGEDIYEKIETMRKLAKAWRGDEGPDRDGTSFSELGSFASKLTDAELFKVSRAFTHFLAIANAAEAHHRVRRLRESGLEDGVAGGGALYPKKDSCGGVLPDLLEAGISADQIYEALSTLSTELVLTAHPTEVNRRTTLQKHQRIQKILTNSDLLRATGGGKSFLKAEYDTALWREVSSLWLSDEVSRAKPTPEHEAERGTLVIETVLWDAVPLFLRKLDATAQEFLGKGLPFTAKPIRFASWMGGDRDGNPNVKPDTTRKVCLRNRAKAATLFASDLEKLYGELSIKVCSKDMRDVVGDAREPYRAFLKSMIQKLHRTRIWAEQELVHLDEDHHMARHLDKVSVDEIYVSKKEFNDELLMMHASLMETNNESSAEGILTDVIRKVTAFGLTLIPLDVRQESDRHEEALDCITKFLGLGSYSQWDEEAKIEWLCSQIASKRPLVRSGVWNEHPDVFSETAVDTLEIHKMIAEQHEDSLGAYVISQATNASDVLAVLLLQLDAGVKKPLRVSPLFETLDDLNGAFDTMKKLFSLPVYMGAINGKQEIMIGYSDSAKDAGRLSAVYAQFQTQTQLAELGREKGIDITFFHGKGGTVGRGGNPAVFKAIMAHAPNTINGQFRVTEQGEMIQQNFGHGDRAERTMDVYTAAVLAENVTKRTSPPKEWTDLMTELSDISCEAYRKIVRHDERFVPYFRKATPELELGNLNIGSRPAKRNPTGGVESLRAIPWNFAWTQTRSNLPTWLGVGPAIQQTLDNEEKAPILKDMYKNYDSFRTMIDLVEMVLAKSEPDIAKHYDDMLVDDEKAQELGAEVRAIHLATEQAVLALTGHKTLGANNEILQRALEVRNPYVDCLNILQAETLKRIRKVDSGEEGILKDALLTTITGVANGMGNSG